MVESWTPCWDLAGGHFSSSTKALTIHSVRGMRTSLVGPGGIYADRGGDGGDGIMTVWWSVAAATAKMRTARIRLPESAWGWIWDRHRKEWISAVVVDGAMTVRPTLFLPWDDSVDLAIDAVRLIPAMARVLLVGTTCDSSPRVPRISFWMAASTGLVDGELDRLGATAGAPQWLGAEDPDGILVAQVMRG